MRGWLGMGAAVVVAAVAVVLLVLTLQGAGPLGGGAPDPGLGGTPSERPDLDPAATADPAAAHVPSTPPAPLPAIDPATAAGTPTAPELPAATPGAVAEGTLRTLAKSKRTEAPLAVATLALYATDAPADATEPTHRSEPSGPDGVCVLADAPAGTWRVQVERPGCAPANRGTVTLGGTGGVDLGDSWLVPNPALTGTVHADDQAAGGATVAVVNEIALVFGPEMDIFKALKQLKDDEVSYALTTADAHGAYTIWWDEVTPGAFVVRASHTGRASAFASVTLPESGATAERDLQCAAPAALSGRVVDINGAACANCRVVVMPEPDPRQFMQSGKMVFFRTQTVTDADGAFQFDNLRTGQYMLWAGGGRYATKMEERVRVPATDVQVQLAPALTLVGRVTDQQSGTPIAGAQVGAGGPGGFDVTDTDAEGRYRLEGLSGEQLDVFVKAEGYAQIQRRAPGGEGEVTFDLQLSGGLRLAGRVVRAGSQEPVANATVLAMHQGGNFGMGGIPSTTTDAQGRFTLTGLALFEARTEAAAAPARAEVRLVVQAEGWVQAQPTALQLVPGEQPKDLVIPMDAAAVVEGRVVGPDGTGVAGASVRVRQRLSGPDANRDFELEWMLNMMKAGQGITTDAAGRFRAPSVRPGARTIVIVRHPEFPVGRSVEFVTRGGATATDVKVSLAAGATVLITAVDETGAPVATQSLALVRTPTEGAESANPEEMMEEMDMASAMFGGAVRQGETSADGRLELRGVPVGEYTIRGDGPLVLLAPVPVHVTEPGRPVRVEVRCTRPLSIRGIVRDADGKPVADAWVHAGREGEQISGVADSAQSDARGEFVIEGVAPGEYQLSAWADGLQAHGVKAVAGARDVQLVVRRFDPAPVPAAGD